MVPPCPLLFGSEPTCTACSWRHKFRASFRIKDGKVQPGHAEQDRLISGPKDCPGERGFF